MRTSTFLDLFFLSVGTQTEAQTLPRSTSAAEAVAYLDEEHDCAPLSQLLTLKGKEWVQTELKRSSIQAPLSTLLEDSHQGTSAVATLLFRNSEMEVLSNEVFARVDQCLVRTTVFKALLPDAKGLAGEVLQLKKTLLRLLELKNNWKKAKRDETEGRLAFLFYHLFLESKKLSNHITAFTQAMEEIRRSVSQEVRESIDSQSWVIQVKMAQNQMISLSEWVTDAFELYGHDPLYLMGGWLSRYPASSLLSVFKHLEDHIQSLQKTDLWNQDPRLFGIQIHAWEYYLLDTENALSETHHLLVTPTIGNSKDAEKGLRLESIRQLKELVSDVKDHHSIIPGYASYTARILPVLEPWIQQTENNVLNDEPFRETSTTMILKSTWAEIKALHEFHSAVASTKKLKPSWWSAYLLLVQRNSAR